MNRFFKENSSILFAISAGGGVIATAYLSAVAGYKTANVLAEEDPTMDLKEKARVVWRLYLPTAGASAAAIVCIAGVKRIDGSKALAAQTALAVAQQGYSQYREKIIEEFGTKKDQLIKAKVDEELVQTKPPPSIVAGSGTVLCCEAFTGRYFMSDIETLNSAVNELNAKMLRHDYATLSELYYILGLESTVVSDSSGWRSDRLLELEFSSVLHDGKPCMVFDYNYVTTL